MVGLFDNQQEALANYSYSEISSGIGLVNFYGVVGGATPTYYLTTSTPYSGPMYTEAINGALAKTHDVDFDIVINKAITIQGNTVVSVPIYCAQVGGGFSNSNIYIVAKVRKWAGAAETDLATGTSETRNMDAAVAADRCYLFGVPISIPNNTKFKRGETLRLTIEVWHVSGGGNCKVDLIHDPANRIDWVTGNGTGINSGNYPSQLLLPLPTKIQL